MTRLKFLKLSLLSILGLIAGANGRAAEQRDPEHTVRIATPTQNRVIRLHGYSDGSSTHANGWRVTTLTIPPND